MMSEAKRAWLYRVSTAVIPLLASYSILNDADVAGWLAVVTAVFNTSLASVNTSPSRSAGSKPWAPPQPRDRGNVSYELLLLLTFLVIALVLLGRL